jgi:ABC-type dipeptide/oligopeptide/nickel transport system permease subunit
MSKQVHDIIESGAARIVGAPQRERHETDRSFGLPGAIYGAMVGCYLGFLAIVAVTFGNPALAIPLVIFALAIIAGFGVPSLWTQLKDNASAAPTSGEFARDGVMTHTGRLSAGEAAIQILTLPVLVVVWGVVAFVIAALVR